MTMERIFHHYDKWEDFHNGMYDEDSNDRKKRVELAASILGIPETCEKAMRMVIETWTIACEVNLSNAEINRRAWLGQAACSIYAGVHEDETREAWGMLTIEQRTTANAIATRLIKAWLREHDNEKSDQINLFDDWGAMFENVS